MRGRLALVALLEKGSLALLGRHIFIALEPGTRLGDYEILLPSVGGNGRRRTAHATRC